MSQKVSIVPCGDYSPETARAALVSVLAPLGGLDWVTAGMKIAVKANIVGRHKPEDAAVTHPALLAELCRLLVERGASVVVGDSPSGPFSAAWLSAVYSGCGMSAVEAAGGELNRDFSVMTAAVPEGAVVKSFEATAWPARADAVIDFAKLKTHAMAGMTCAVKNFYGVIPGARKAELHYVHPRSDDFCDMLIDLCLWAKPRLTLVDAVECMEGNGPTQGTPRHMGALIAADSPYEADLLCARLIGMETKDAGTVRRSIVRGLCPADWRELDVCGDPEAFALPDFEKLPPREDIRFGRGIPVVNRFLEQVLGTGPRVNKKLCVGCGKCAEVCPAGAAKVRGGKCAIDRLKCIRCFCCQEFCPKGAVTVHTPPVAKLLEKI